MKTDSKETIYWRSLEDFETASDDGNEFPAGASDPPADDGTSRRGFMRLMGASVAFAGAAGLAGCRRWEKEEIVPLARRPEGYIPGVPKQYATAMEVGGVATGLLATAYDGRPVKVDGNPDHPTSGSGSTTFAQASVLELYDPDRSQRVIRRVDGKKSNTDWVAFEELARELGNKAPQLKLRVLSEATSSPTLATLGELIKRRFPQAEWHEWEPLSFDNEHKGTEKAFGQPVRPIYDLSQADVVVALDSDFLVDHPNALMHAQGFAAKRRPDEDEMSRVYAVESTHSSTGAVADHRLPLRSELVLPFAMALLARLQGGTPPAASFLSEGKVPAFLDAIAEDLKGARGRAVVIAGHRQPPEVHAIAALLNAPGQGRAVSYINAPQRPTHAESITSLANELSEKGKVDALVILGGNPAFDAPAELDFGSKIANAGTSIHLSLYDNETSAQCEWHLPRAHFLEAWSDGLAWDGTYTVTQPVIEPLYKGKTPYELLALLLGNKVASARELIRQTHDGLSQAPLGGTEKAWRKTLHDGYLGRKFMQPVNVTPRQFRPEPTARQLGGIKLPKNALEIVFKPSPHAYDGRYANSSWLLETPDFMTKATWDNVALVGPATAAELGIDNYTLIEIATEGRPAIKVPAYVMPGQAPYSIAVELGLGRTRAGRVAGHAEDGDATVGHDTYPLRTAGAMYIASGSVSATGSSYPIATTQDHWKMDSRGRETIDVRMSDLVREGTLKEYSANKAQWQRQAFPRHLPRLEVESLWSPPYQYDGYKWGMSTDLSKCIGCNACMLACQAENNVPVVGKTEVMRSREMHWIRIDRYFSGDMNDPEVTPQPVVCQQCEKAPCEQVCPVGATIHSDEGLNDMAYNRCVGTRYCLNNCPYKVRRFNFLDWHKDLEPSEHKVKQLVFNPQVTVRSRGVMEKCTFCVQRIQNVKIQATNDGRRVRDGEIKTACQEACPTGAIVFGDLNGKDAEGEKSEVAKKHESPRAYDMLHEYNTHPRNKFLARISNPNPKLAPAKPAKKH